MILFLWQILGISIFSAYSMNHHIKINLLYIFLCLLQPVAVEEVFDFKLVSEFNLKFCLELSRSSY